MNRNILLAKKQKFSFYTALLIAISLTSCAHLTHLDRAQDAFSKGAELENAYLFNPSSSSVSSPKTYYDLAYAEVDKALESKGKLKKVNVLGTAYSIKALSAWKRDDYNQARTLAKTAKRYLNSDSNTTGQKINISRDYAVMEAMDALITIETSNDSIYMLLDSTKTITATTAMDIYKQLIHNSNSTGRIEAAISQLDSISATVSEKHEVRVYFNMSQLAGLKIWNDALGKVLFHLSEANEEWYNIERDLYLAKKDIYLKALAEKIPKKEEDSVYVFWKFILQ